MTKRIRFSPIPPIATSHFDLLPEIEMNGSELRIFWHICEESQTNSIYRISKTELALPSNLKPGIFSSSPSLDKKAEKKIQYKYPSIHKSLARLEKMGFIQSIKDTKGPRIRRILKPTFSGLLLYLKSSENSLIKNVLGHHERMFPFSEIWSQMLQQLSEETVVATIEKTVDEFYVYEATFRINSLSLEFDSYLSGIAPLTGERDEKTTEFLKTEQGKILRDSYISYLALHDIERLSRKNRTQIKRMLSELDSEKELAYFENREVHSNTLFTGKRLKEYFPKFAVLEFFFTGMFTKNLLWSEQEKEQPHPAEFGIEVDYKLSRVLTTLK